MLPPFFKHADPRHFTSSSQETRLRNGSQSIHAGLASCGPFTTISAACRLKSRKAQKKPCRNAGSNMYDPALDRPLRPNELLVHCEVTIGIDAAPMIARKVLAGGRARGIRRDGDQQATAVEAI